ncbi:MAG TPA: flagellar motor switch protein FliN [Idiomarina baltica]|jgi:flagellar motor switch protein FliN/FliY|uniref:Flagellar motor switch protein FliN n=1 Tax=Idiomarina baltica TaxID=190892 RepID=A0A348WQ67_9GAMM|nr:MULTISPECIES: flagellar motor switch protein FliN [unclassified Idiomarina]KXS34135.1 MAG: flagellar motor switch protein FliN/FliY [Idiomarina sp. T82-3]HAE90156.1 flagellar motor switch protein FliN [Idiomarina sp.]HAR56679.1 flagellar motor switch protein FliN [Idiomarina baltica]|tara:strand:+ start:289 stop:711 length:423 start_codon:yes stop_codon:yes gene_type:complete
MSNKDNEMDDWEAAMAEQAASEEGESEDNADKQSEGVRTAELEELNAESLDDGDKRKLDAILDIPVTISMEVGRSQISIRNLLQLNQGSVVELERVAGEPLDVLVNGTLIAHGEVVVVNDKFGIRLTDVISQIERIRKLR